MGENGRVYGLRLKFWFKFGSLYNRGEAVNRVDGGDVAEGSNRDKELVKVVFRWL